MKYGTEIAEVAAKFALDPLLVAGQVLTESGGETSAWNPEPRYRWFWDVKLNKPFRIVTTAELNAKTPPADFHCLVGDPDQEWWGQQASWGLLQVMGAVAREHGFTGGYLTALCVYPVVGLEVGCRHMADLLKWSSGNVDKALAAYNGGKSGNEVLPFRNQAYATKVRLAKSQVSTLIDA